MELCKGCRLIKACDMFFVGQGKSKESRNKKAITGYVSQAKPKEIKTDRTSKIMCECGGRYTYTNRATHMKTLKHINTMKALNKQTTEAVTSRRDQHILNKIEKLNVLIKQSIELEKSLHKTTDEEEFLELRDQLSLNQLDYNIHKSKILEMMKYHNEKYNLTSEQYDSQEDCLYAVNEYKQTVMEEHKRGK